MDGLVGLVEALAKLAGALAWPALLLLLVLRAGPELREFFRNLSEFSLKGGGFEASAKRSQAAAALAAAAATNPRAPADAAPVSARSAADVVASNATTRNLARLAGAVVLWVDDSPANNHYERAALEAVGLRFVLATSTEEALRLSAAQPVDAIISDMGRAGDARAGYTLLEQLRARGSQTPFIIYAGSRSPEHVAQALAAGAFGATNQPDELFAMVLSAVLGRAA